jgi:O-antigen ligase
MRTLAFALSLVVVFTIPWENAILVGEWGTLSRFLGILMACAWIASVLIRPQVRTPHPFHIVMFAFVLWNAASLFWTLGNDETIQRIKTYAQLAFLSWIIWDLYTTNKALRTVLQVYVLGAYVTIGGTIYNYVLGREIKPYSGGRYSGAGLNAIEAALILALGLPIAWHLAVVSPGEGSKKRFLTALNYAFIPLSLFAMVLTASRTLLIAVIPYFLYVLWTCTRIKFRSRVLVFAALGGIVIALLSYAPQSAIERLATIRGSVASMEFGGRADLWRKTTAVFAENPIFGIGSGAVQSTAGVGVMAHNTFLSVAAELGLVGIFILFCMLAIVVHQMGVQIKELSKLWMTVLAILMIAWNSLTWEYTKATWLILSLVVISANLSENRLPISGSVSRDSYLHPRAPLR